jgi:hypothetical protein
LPSALPLEKLPRLAVSSPPGDPPGRNTVAKKTRAARRETFVVASKVKSYVRAKGYNVSSELVAELSNRAQDLLDRAADRCKKNGRRTVRKFDV